MTEENKLKPKEIRMWIDEDRIYKWDTGDKLTVADMYIMAGILQDDAMRAMRQTRLTEEGEKDVDKTENDMEHNQK